MIEVRKLARSYGDLKAVDGVSFEVGRGEIVGLLGHNGAGKTTIMKMLTGFLEPSDGEILIDGLDIERQRRAVQRRIGYLPENCPLYPEMTVIDYLDYQAALHGIAATERPATIREAIARTELETKATDPIATLSRGYRQRVGVAQAILHHPAVLILDEPTNGLDPSQIEHMRTLIRNLAETATLMISTHILQEVEAVCDRVLILRAGHLALDARLADLRATGRLLVSLDGEAAEAEGLLRGLHGVEACTLVGPAPGSADGPLRYALDTADPEELAPRVANTIVAQGWPLYGLQRERRDLQGLFHEVNAGKEAPHV